MKFLEAQGVPRNRIIDGRVFKVPNLDFPRLLKEGVAYGVLDTPTFGAGKNTIYPQHYSIKNNPSIVALGKKSYIASFSTVDGSGVVTTGNFSSISQHIRFELGMNGSHDYKKVASFDLWWYDWVAPADFYKQAGACRINIGSDVWIGRGCILKCTNPNKPLIIGDGAVIASDSVVVKNVPPYAIVGGNPAKIIKFRFSEEVIEALLRIKWWDWSLDKIHDNFKYFNDIDKFIALHDR